jgi:hypothetical protein
MLLSNESVTHGSCGSRRKRHSGIHTATLNSMGRFPAPPPFHFETNVEGTDWFDPLLHPHGPFPPTVGFIVPGGFESYARLLHPACRVFGQSAEQSVPLRWSEIAAAPTRRCIPRSSSRRSSHVDSGEYYAMNFDFSVDELKPGYVLDFTHELIPMEEFPTESACATRSPNVAS